MRKSALAHMSEKIAITPSNNDHTKLKPARSQLSHFVSGAKLEGLSETQIMKRFEILQLTQSPSNRMVNHDKYTEGLSSTNEGRHMKLEKKSVKGAPYTEVCT